MIQQLSGFLGKPQLYASGTGEFWDDAHISKGMLEAHLDPQEDGATRKHEFLDRSVQWISKIAPPAQYKYLLDLGCGPGLYAQRFHEAGYSVIGVDFSRRSIAYAKEQAIQQNRDIEYHYQNYLTMDYENQFDVVTLIYCDYAVLPKEDRLVLLNKIYKALRQNGKFIVDVFTPSMRKNESRTWQFYEEGGFWCEKPHICLESVYQYDDEDATELRQCIVLTDESIDCYNIWDHFFSKEKLLLEIQTADFNGFEFYGDAAGKQLTDDGETICGVFTK
ncbi:class I SAM-dependent methyltransferase [Bacilliculturomica massiliensis]|uniref:class I SAM-dependent methyltransferase n=1 Tax=Bacilliculturomica massiliensis TaxID=1917867 RepID=UPI001030A0F2|nr:class I SAM-dependent methyltransferase [Bacilliculturomica massiliensis]